jgi:hypothetical protein
MKHEDTDVELCSALAALGDTSLIIIIASA